MRSNRPVRWWVTAILCMSIVAGACSGGGPKATPPTAHKPIVPALQMRRTTGPFSVVLTAGHPGATATADVAVAKGDKLTPSEISAVEKRLPAFQGGSGAVPFNRPPESLPRPRVGATITKPFGGSAPAPKPKPTDSGPLQVVRYQPIGDVDIAPDLSVTFNQPMVPLTTLSQLDQADVPVKVTPALNGRWRWIGTRTLRFEFTGAEDRLPMATSYQVVVPAGTASQSGHKLATAVSWTFRTPPPKVLTFAPENTTVDTTPLFVATFDQRVDPDAVIKTISLTASGNKVAIRRATTAEIIADDQVHQISQDAPDGRWIVFRPVSDLPNGAALTDLHRARHSLGRGAANHDDGFGPHGQHLLGARGHGHPMRLRRRLPARNRLRHHVQQRPRREIVRREPREDHARARRVDRRRGQHPDGQRVDEARHPVRRAPSGVTP